MIQASSQQSIELLIQQIETVIKGKRPSIELVLSCLLAGGHILVEDNPGTGKTLLARALAQSISGNGATGEAVFKRIQFTPDLLPMDLIGTHIFDEENRDFIFRKGPLFCNILLADEINRASPKVQSALLESMAEGQITAGETTYILEELFFTIATQNPIEMEGTYPLPSAQLDRFFMKINFGYVNEETELEILNGYSQIALNLTHLHQVVSMQDVLALRKNANNIYVHPELIRAVSNIVRGSREHAGITVGASTRAGIAFLRCLRAFALVKGRQHVVEGDVQQLCASVLQHRLYFKNKDAKENGLREVLDAEMIRLSRLNLEQI